MSSHGRRDGATKAAGEHELAKGGPTSREATGIEPSRGESAKGLAPTGLGATSTTGARDHLARLFRAHAEAMRKAAHGILGDHDDAEDVVQQIFLRILARWNLYSGRKLTRVYLVRAARNGALDMLRQGRPEISLAPEGVRTLTDLRADSLELAVKEEESRLLAAFIESLPPACREVVSRIVSGQQTQREVARELGIGTKAVEKQMSRAYRLAQRVGGGGGAVELKTGSADVHKRGRGGVG